VSIATEIIRLQTAKENIKTAIENKGVTVGSSDKIDSYPTYINQIQTFDPYNGHAYVEIGGLKWATMNIGASSITDYGLYFQWGDTSGYESSQVGATGKPLVKTFAWADYKFSNGNTAPGASGMTKYNSGDTKTVLDICDDAARENWGGGWRMPTTDEYAALGAAVNSAWTSNYQGSGVSGLVLTDKTDSSKVLFFPAAGRCLNGSVEYVGRVGDYWSSSVDSSRVQYAYHLLLNSNYVNWQERSYRVNGFAVRGVLGE
jgi:uncharacterized protein (TIGR02145 family)